jgi:metal-responsive CopG/Arc/MetJ family transcriptional regulator
MHRTNIFLEDRQVAALDARARREGTTRAEVIRRLVDQGLARMSRDLEHDLAAIDASFGVLEADDLPVREPDGEREEHLDQVWGS